MSILLIVSGSLMVFKTSLFWLLTARWMSNDATEPSDLYVWNTRFGGGICLLLGLVCLFIAFFIE
ncbi:DUF6199 family natural product biosynthesis protein [Paenibacillus xerothermodurans]|uniref:DUF6199 family natural product biosynthesis protein n=1 Tax=Paenibacillus xerothermodurans TaxID=1977292 RepID=UPI003C70B045